MTSPTPSDDGYARRPLLLDAARQLARRASQVAADALAELLVWIAGDGVEAAPRLAPVRVVRPSARGGHRTGASRNGLRSGASAGVRRNSEDAA